HLDPIFIQQSSTLALDQAKAEVVRMGEYSYQGMEETNLFLITQQQKHAETAKQIEGALNNLDRKITDYLINSSTRWMPDEESELQTILMDTLRDIERIGDHIENVSELIDSKISNIGSLTDQGRADLNNMFDLTIMTVKQSASALAHGGRDEAL